MKGKKKYEPEIGAYALSEKIVKAFNKFNVNIEILDWKSYENRVRYIVKLKGSTRQTDIFAHASDVQARLELPLFQVYKEKFTIYIVASDKDVAYPRLPKILNDSAYDELFDEMELPYIVGHSVLGQPVIVDLSTFPHLLLGGSTNSGKSVGLQALVTTLIRTKCPSEVNLLLIDVGAGNLIGFEGIPHLSCPVVRDYDTACNTLTALKAEMERRIKFEHTSAGELKRFPRLVLVVDEFPALLMGTCNRKALKSLVDIISSLLQRGQHAEIHLALVAQNPTFNNMKVDLGNITARIAFKCARKNFSETILGESGAENLSGSGRLLLKSPQNNVWSGYKASISNPKIFCALRRNLNCRNIHATRWTESLISPFQQIFQQKPRMIYTPACARSKLRQALRIRNYCLRR